MSTDTSLSRRRVVSGLLVLAAAPAVPAFAQVAFPYYRGEDALQGLYARHMPALARAFETQAGALTAAVRGQCGKAEPAALLQAWRQALLAWHAVSAPALGPVVARRSQRQIDFWPMRPPLLKKALDSAPRTLADMARVGTPAKGFPTLETLLRAQPFDTRHCGYLALIAEGIEAEAVALREAFDQLAGRDWTEDEEGARTAFAEWINQWLGGLERLRWIEIEQPVQRARTAGHGRAPEFARQTMADNIGAWRAQWQALRAQARLHPAQLDTPPQPGQDLVPIEALLMGKGHMAVAQRWVQAIDGVDGALAALPAQPSGDDLMALSRTMKKLTSLYQGEVASALDVPLGFSDADGD